VGHSTARKEKGMSKSRVEPYRRRFLGNPLHSTANTRTISGSGIGRGGLTEEGGVLVIERQHRKGRETMSGRKNRPKVTDKKILRYHAVSGHHQLKKMVRTYGKLGGKAINGVQKAQGKENVIGTNNFSVPPTRGARKGKSKLEDSWYY